jgi:hypothetical protein
LPEISYNIILFSNNLISLEGFKQDIVNGDCSFNKNKLTSLKYGPKKIIKKFGCSFNNLDSLEGFPEEVGEDVYCTDNKRKFTEEEIRSVCKVGGKVIV